MSLMAAGIASGIHLLSCVIASIRIGRIESLWFVVFLPIYTFVSCLFYTIILAISVGYTYQLTGTRPDNVLVYWGIAFGVLYVVLKFVVAGYVK
jgi:hypothetical protein